MFGKKKDESEPDLGIDISEFDKKEQREIERIKTILEMAEKIKAIARQSKIAPGGSLVTPNIIFATDKRLIIRDPTALGLRAGIESIPYSQINKVHLQKGAFTSELVMNVGQFETGDNEQKIPAIPKKKAAEIVGIINGHIRGAQSLDSLNEDPSSTKNEDPSSTKNDDPLQVLKLRFVNGEITKEEFENMKSVLE